MGLTYPVQVGDQTAWISPPPTWTVTHIPERPSHPLADPIDALAGQLLRPVAGPALHELARDASRVTIVVCDLTRPSPDDRILPPILTILESAGVHPERIQILIGTGLHRPVTPAEIASRFACALERGVRITSHNACDPEQLVTLGDSRDGVPIQIHRAVAQADLVLTTGIVEPHQFAGFSGGWKTVVIGAGGECTINGCHTPRFLKLPGVGIGRVRGNPFQEFMEEAGRSAKVRFAVNTVLDGAGNILAIAAGTPDSVYETLVSVAEEQFFCPVDRDYDVVISGAPSPKDSNLYQASRVPTYLQLGRGPLVRDGGTLIVGARCPEGTGHGAGEERFAALLESAQDPADLVRTAESEGLPGGGQRAYFMARVLSKVKIVFVGASDPESIRRTGILTTPDFDSAWSHVTQPHDRPVEALIVEDPFRTLPMRVTAQPILDIAEEQ